MPNADGYITYSTKLDNTELEADLKRSKKSIADLQKEIEKTANKRLPLEENFWELSVKLDKAQAKLAELDAGAGTARQLEAAQDKVDGLQMRFDKAADKLERSDVYAATLQKNLEGAKIQAAGLEQQLAKKQNLQPLNDAVDGVEKKLMKFGKRMTTMFRKVFMFSILLAAFRSVRSWFGQIIKTNDEAVAAIARLKGAMLTMAQPIVEVAVPAFIKLVNVLTMVVQVLAKATSLLFGKRLQDSAANAKALDKERKAISGVGSAAKKATGFLASFDEVNQVQDDSSSGSGASSSGIDADFSSFDPSNIQSNLDKLTAILGGALFAVGAILAFSGVNVPLGITLMALGAAILYKEAAQNWDKLPQQVREAISGVLTLVGIVALTVGLCLALSGVNISLGLGLVALGAASIVAAAALNWDELGNTMVQKLAQIGVFIGPCIAVVGVFLLITGHFPLGVAMIIAGAAIFSVSEAVLNWDALGNTVTEKLGNIAIIVGGLLAVVGVILMLTGIGFGIGLAMVIAGCALFVGGSIAAQWDSVPNTVSAKLALILKVVGGFLAVLGIVLMLTGIAFPLGLGLLIAGAGLLGASAVTANWNFISDKVKSCWTAVKQYYSSNIKQYLSFSYWKNKAGNIINGLVSGIKNGLGSIKNAITGTVSSAWGSVKSVFTGRAAARSVQATPARVYPEDVPALAKGAVIPANRKFMAVLGDQTNGNNLEAPESLIRRIVREESGGADSQTVALLQAILAAVQDGKVLMVDKRVLGKVAAAAMGNASRTSGAAVIPL